MHLYQHQPINAAKPLQELAVGQTHGESAIIFPKERPGDVAAQGSAGTFLKLICSFALAFLETDLAASQVLTLP